MGFKEGGGEGQNDKVRLILTGFISFFIISIIFLGYTGLSSASGKDVDSIRRGTIVDVIKNGERPKAFGDVWFNLKEPFTLEYNLSKEGGNYLYMWSPYVDLKAPYKGWLTVENGFYRVKINLDHSYYLLFDKLNNRDLLIYNDEVEDPINILTGADMGFADHGGENPDSFVSTSINDIDGIARYHIRWEDREEGFILLGLEGWDYLPSEPGRGYYVEGEVLLGLYVNKPSLIDATEVNNLKSFFNNPIEYMEPDEIGKSWVLTSDYDSAVLRGGDLDHLNADWWKPWYSVQDLNGEGRKPWHLGSAAFSKMFPDHRLIGSKSDGAIIFSLPRDKFRFDDSLGIYGDQVVGEFLLVIEEPVKAISFTVDPVNEYNYFYDQESFNEEYLESMRQICVKYSLDCPDNDLDEHNWETKRFAYVITLVEDWYDSNSNVPYDQVWDQADEGLIDFKRFEDIIYEELESTEPLMIM